MKFENYNTEGFFDEMFDESGRPRPAAFLLKEAINALPEGELLKKQQAAEKALHSLGITFNVYGEGEGVERVWPFDIIPRVIDGREWDLVEEGLKQRIRAINLFIDDVYHDAKIVKDGIFPEDLLASAVNFSEPCRGYNPPKGIWCHITGTDLVRGGDGTIYVLEDNLRVPSGVSYVLANRLLLKRTFPELFSRYQVRPVVDYPNRLLSMLHHVKPEHVENPVIGVLTPGMYNSAYYEHSYLAQELGAELVEGSDLVVRDNIVYMKTTRGLQRVDVLYRRISDDFLDPRVFRPDSMLGIPGIFNACRAGNISLVNAPGTGVADDKVVYAFVPDMIRYYLGEEPKLPNVPTHLCYREEDLAYTLEHLDELVVKPANESGGYGMLIGPKATKEEISAFANHIKMNPRNYIAQPTLSLSRAPVIVGGDFEGRHLDLRPFILYGDDIYVVPGGLTRVALQKGSLVVNSSQGGGSKDTWVVDAIEQGGHHA